MKIFIDANAFIGAAIIFDLLHKKTLEVSRYLQQLDNVIYFTSSDVVKEAVTVIAQRTDKTTAIEFLNKIETKAKIIFIDEELHQQGLKIFEEVRQKNISAVDCTSFAVMRKLDIEYAFSFDMHFERMGFKLIRKV